jgi:cell division protein FtsI/penicillin-binding protein 2
LEKSLNTGAVFAARKTGLDVFRNYVKNFGFGSLTNIEQAGEAVGDISNLEKPGEIYLATASFGQGISVTPIQMLTAVAAIANQGRLLKPYLVDKIIYSDGTVVQNQPKFIRQVISPATAITLSAMMVSVLENGYGKLARVPNYWIAGKTGTAQVANPTGGYSEKTIHSFVGFGPSDNPVFVGLVKINNPKKGRFAESTAAPVFGKIAEYILKYYNVPPNR